MCVAAESAAEWYVLFDQPYAKFLNLNLFFFVGFSFLHICRPRSYFCRQKSSIFISCVHFASPTFCILLWINRIFHSAAHRYHSQRHRSYSKNSSFKRIVLFFLLLLFLYFALIGRIFSHSNTATAISVIIQHSHALRTRGVTILHSLQTTPFKPHFQLHFWHFIIILFFYANGSFPVSLSVFETAPVFIHLSQLKLIWFDLIQINFESIVHRFFFFESTHTHIV